MHGASRLHLMILICILCASSIVGSIANLFFICIFKLIFNRKFNHNIQSKLAESSIGFELKERSTQIDTIEKSQPVTRQSHSKSTELYESYVQLKNKLAYNSSMKILYNLIYYLAIVDLFTCLFSVPVTAYEVWYPNRLNEFSCRLFEFMRSFGVLLSNFLIILIAIEQFKSLSANRDFSKKKWLLYICIIMVLLSVLISTFFTFQVSIYQKAVEIDEDKMASETYIVNTGVCLKSESGISFKTASILNLSITILVFIIGGIFVVILYTIIFLKSFSLNKR